MTVTRPQEIEEDSAALDDLRADWRNRAACINQAPTVALCRNRCPVRLQCLRWAMSLDPEDDPDDVAGGFTRGQRAWRRRRGGQSDQNAGLKQCSRCEQTKHINEFNRHRKTADGYEYQCRSCARKTTTETRRKRIQQPKVTPPELTCQRCKQVKPCDDFAIDRSRPTGRQKWCRSCTRDWLRSHRNTNQEGTR